MVQSVLTVNDSKMFVSTQACICTTCYLSLRIVESFLYLFLLFMSGSRASVETVSEGSTSKQEESSLAIIQEVYLFMVYIMCQYCNEIPVQGNYSYFTAFPEFTTMCNLVRTLSVVNFQRIFDFVRIDSIVYPSMNLAMA